ncbi:ATP-binding protein [Pseudomonas sp. GD03842]|uniref:PAS domain-containing sensor histidine kinase n=1 Tax=unclassified Pseudomonas TaxID=196821 RepID=UPI000D34C0CA|nr:MULTISPECIES: ATP-binding protein [unclassified Pseudomonas]MDH0748888.1 ATP-binding protein [Pseudomonas sp. GD03842]RAU44114.1 PAS domain S-box protein [Pseudomonas sp. RIT 409]RAU54859.1 PAS domain S-box protein [Pseudomonas sp. RIT 412]
MTPPLSRAEAEVFERFHDAVFVRDMEGTIHFWNSASAALYGWPSHTALGANARTLLKCKHGCDAHSTADAQVLADGYWEGELSRLTGSGDRRLVNARWSLLKDAGGNPVGILETGYDISSAKDLERHLKASEYRYRNLFQAMAASFWELDFTAVGPKIRALLDAGVRDLEPYFLAHPEVVRDMMQSTRVLDLNDHSLRLFGRGDRNEMLGTIDRYWPDESIQVYARCVVKSLAGLPNNIEVTRLRTLEGNVFECLFTACFSKENLARGVILIGIIDLSELAAARHALEIMQTELAHVARISILGELSASITHEIKQPLTSISTYAQAALRWLKRPQPDLQEVENALLQIIGEAQRTDDVIGRIRAMALRRPAEETQVSLNEVVQDSLKFTDHELRKHSIRLTLDLTGALPPVRADRVLLQQVIVNLVMNAAQAMASANRSPRALTLRSDCPDGRQLRIEVLDSGPGIAPGLEDKVFQSFFTTKSTGMGMGLPICRSIIEAAGGQIRMANREDGQSGARVTVTLPGLAVSA